MKLIVLALVSACSLSTTGYTGGGDDGGTTGDDDGEVAHSGHRLQVERYAFGASTAPIGIVDSKLDVECSSFAWVDGTSYCTPSNSFIVYGDIACATPMLQPFFGNTMTTGLYAVTDNGNSQITHLYQGGELVEVAQFYDNSSGTCIPAGSTGGTAYAVAAEVSPSQLVAVTTEHDATGVMSYSYTRGADGLQTVSNYQFHDNSLGVDCFEGAQASKQDTAYCLPVPLALTSNFGDGGCTDPLQGTNGPISSTPALYTEVYPPSGACFLIDRTYPLQGTVTRNQVFVREAFSDVCSAGATGEQMYTATTTAIPLPPLVHALANQPGRRIVNAVRTFGSQQFLDGDFYDTELGTYCGGSVQPDGQIVCGPEGLSTETFYTDAACTLSITVATVYAITNGCGYAMPKFASQVTGTTSQVLPITADVVPPLYDASTGTCQPLISPNAHFSVGAPVPLSTFATGSIVTDPVAP